jgi:aminoglycoside phosphotransferase family enzyme/predicted kinase
MAVPAALEPGTVSLDDLIAGLSRAEAYPHPVGDVDVRQTHLSVVFLAGDRAYKVKKPIDLGFADYRSPERRLHFCREEVRLNRRLAPAVYLGVVPITRDGDQLAIGGDGEPVEWAVEMARLPDDARLRERVARGEASAGTMAALAARVAAFHRAADGGEAADRFARFDAVAANAEENFAQTVGHVGRTVSPAVFCRVAELTRAELGRVRPAIESRAAAGVARDGHGDLHLDHVYLFPDRPPPDDLAVVDCIEFAERFRYGDPVADAAFLAMDLLHEGRRDLADAFVESYLRAAGDPGGREVLRYYVAYRAVVRAKVAGIRAGEPEVPAADRAAARDQARSRWLLALSVLEAPARRPALVLVGGLPGAGKSTLARGLAGAAGFTVIRSDVVRKELAGTASGGAAPAPFGEGIYTREWTDRTYAECLTRAERVLADGGRVIVDASFCGDRYREQCLAAARRWGVPGVLFVCQAEPAAVWARLRARRDDPSDADWSIYTQAARAWDEYGPAAGRALRLVDTGSSPDAALRQALADLRELGLYE